MPDISMCSGVGCKVKDTCYRHTAEPSMRQTYFLNSPVIKDGQGCEWYWATEESNSKEITVEGKV